MNNHQLLRGQVDGEALHWLAGPRGPVVPPAYYSTSTVYYRKNYTARALEECYPQKFKPKVWLIEL